MFGNGGWRQPQQRNQLAYAQFPLTQGVEDPQSVPIRQRLEGNDRFPFEALIFRHPPKYRRFGAVPSIPYSPKAGSAAPFLRRMFTQRHPAHEEKAWDRISPLKTVA